MLSDELFATDVAFEFCSGKSVVVLKHAFNEES